jgi:hypothetical protein
MAKKPDMTKANTPQHKLMAAGKATPQSSGKAPAKSKK